MFRYENSSCAAALTPITKEIIYQDTFTRQLFISRYQCNHCADPSNINDWNPRSRLLNYAQQGSLTLAYDDEANPSFSSGPNGDPGYMTFRGVVSDESGDYAANLNVTPLRPATNPADVDVSTQLIQNLYVVTNFSNPNDIDCEKPIKISVGPPKCRKHSTKSLPVE